MAANIMYRLDKVTSRRSRSKHLKGVVHPFLEFHGTSSLFACSSDKKNK